MTTCTHPSDQITADILQGDFKGHQVQWCRQCGAVRVRSFDPDYIQSNSAKSSRKNYISPWNTPTFQIDPLCPTPELKGTHPVVLYFENREEALEFEAAVRAEKPNLKARHL